MWLDVLADEVFELSGVPDQCPVQEFAADGADPSFGVGVRDGRVWRSANDRRALSPEDLIERGDELAGAIADQEPDRQVCTHHEVPCSLRGPGAGRVSSDAREVHTNTSAVR